MKSNMYLPQQGLDLEKLLIGKGFDEIKRVDLYGGTHYNKVTEENIPTPHVHESNIPGEIRNANDNEIPRRNKRLDSE